MVGYRQKFNSIIILILFNLFFVSNFTVSTSDTTQNFILNNETIVLLDETTDIYYNGSISVTVTTGDPVNATVNGVTKEISLGETKELYILNTTILYFSLSTDGYTEGYFVMELNYDPYANSNSTLRRTLAIVSAFIIALSVITYYIRAKRLETKPEEEEEELLDSETLRKRKEAAGAEKKFWGLDDKD